MKHLKAFENFNNIQITKSGGLNCDSCTWNDQSISTDDYHSWINRPCPECGENLLTQEDYDKTIKFLDAVETINTFSEQDIDSILSNINTDDLLDMMNKLKDSGLSNNDDGSYTFK